MNNLLQIREISNQAIFRYNGNGEVFNIPNSALFLQITAIGAGGAGGSGFSRVAGLPGGGGGGGGTGACGSVIIPANLLGKALYVKVGLGGRSGVAGSETRISWMLNTTGINQKTVLICPAGINGGNGTGAAVGAAGSGGTWTLGNNTFAGFGLVSGSSGTAGAAGGAIAGAGGGSLTVLGAMPLSGGAGGAGTTAADFAGGLIIFTGVGLTEIASISGGAAGSNKGGDGYYNGSPLLSIGGGGGGSSNAGNGGAGGHAGSIGAGGGGGGAGVVGGIGGNGGDGMVIITWW